MKLPLQLSCLLLVVTATAFAEVPRKPLASKYRSLWTDSPFTVKPVRVSAPTYNPLQDYVLLGVSPIEEGYRVTLINTKRPKDDRIIVETHRPVDGMKVVEVIRKKGDPLGTEVRLSQAGKTGLVGFEEKYLALKAPPSAPAQRKTGSAAQNIRGAANNPQTSRVPRRRIIPPVPNATKNQNSRQQPTRKAPPGVPIPRTR